MHRVIEILDCTLRDGGNGLEELEKQGYKNALFTGEMIHSIIADMQCTGVNIVEIGSIQRTNDDRRRFAQYQTIEEISLAIPEKNDNNQIFAAIYRTPDEPLENIPAWHEGLCEAVRVVLRYSELEKSLDFCKGLADKGYKIFIQPMVTMRYTDNDLKQLVKAANRMGAYAVYFVDSYGCMDFEDVDRLTGFYTDELKPEIRIGFHAHNNMNMAFANAVYFIQNSGARDIIIDSCAMGMGLGAGNLQTELILNYMNKKYGKNYNMEAVIRVCETVNPLYEERMWGYGLERLVPALQKTAYKYSSEYKNNYNMTLPQIYNLLKGMPDEYRFRFTGEYARDWFEKKSREWS